MLMATSQPALGPIRMFDPATRGESCIPTRHTPAPDHASDGAPRVAPASTATAAAPVPAPTSQSHQPDPEERPIPIAAHGWVADLLGAEGGWRSACARAGIGVALSAVYGVAIGMREGGLAMLTSGINIAAGTVAVLLLAVPALHIILAVLNVPIDALGLARGAASGSAATGLCLAGLAPAAALFVVTSESTLSAIVMAGLGLLLAGVMGLRYLAEPYHKALKGAEAHHWFSGKVAFVAFALFSTILAARVWWPTMVKLGGGA